MPRARRRRHCGGTRRPSRVDDCSRRRRRRRRSALYRFAAVLCASAFVILTIVGRAAAEVEDADTAAATNGEASTRSRDGNDGARASSGAGNDGARQQQWQREGGSESSSDGKRRPFLSDGYRREVLDFVTREMNRGGASSSGGANNGSRHHGKKRKKHSNGKSSDDGRRGDSGGADSSRQGPLEDTLSHLLEDIDTPPRPVLATLPTHGKVVGRRESSVDVWRGVPYASPPVGHLRFAPPEPPQPWSPAKLDASKFGPDCFQLVDPVLNPTAVKEEMSEDCLYLNVFTPAGHADRAKAGKFLSGAKLLPVMVWFHGGAFQQGGSRRSEYDGRRLAERDVVVVTINYRLGALGFLVSSSDGLFGNFGLMDQRAAIDWVRRNVRSFGGDPDNVTLFGESAGAVMIGLHLLMDGAGSLFRRAIMQSNPLGYTFRSVVVADFIGEALKHEVDCRDLACMRAERVEEIMRAQGTLMGVPRSVGDFFTWGPTLTKGRKVQFSPGAGPGSNVVRMSDGHRLPRLDRRDDFVSEWDPAGSRSDSARWASVNVSQPLLNLHLVPDSIPIMLGSNRHEGEMFVHAAFPAPMPKAVYWMFVGALFRDSAARVLRHYRGLVEEVEREAEELAARQLEEEECRQEYAENRGELDREYKMLLAMNSTKRRRREEARAEGGESADGIQTLMNAWSSGGYQAPLVEDEDDGGFTLSDLPNFGGNWTAPNLPNLPDLHLRDLRSRVQSSLVASRDNLASLRERLARQSDENPLASWRGRRQTKKRATQLSRAEKRVVKLEERVAKRAARQKMKALKEAAKVVVDYRPVMSRIIDDYLFRCPGWHYAQLLTEHRERNAIARDFAQSIKFKGKKRKAKPKAAENDDSQNATEGTGSNNVYVYRFSQPTHIPGYAECWGKSCHTAELPYVFQSMDVLRSNYSTVGPYGQDEAPHAPEYPYTDIMRAYRGAFAEAASGVGGEGGADGKNRAEDEDEAQREESFTPADGRNRTSSPQEQEQVRSKAFQRILHHFFGDYFSEDADEELSADMAERWSSFARTSDPNYGGSRAEWRPWRYRPNGVSAEDEVRKAGDKAHDEGGFYDWSDEYDSEYESEDEWDLSDFDDPWADGYDSDYDEFDDAEVLRPGRDNKAARLEARNRRRRALALAALGMEEAGETDPFRTELRRAAESEEDGGSSSGSRRGGGRFLTSRLLDFRNWRRDDEDGVTGGSRGSARQRRRNALPVKQMSGAAAQEAIRAAQEWGALGSGLRREAVPGGGGQGATMPDAVSLPPTEDFFPELLELSWPPEGRLIERDCTCDLWDRIRYRY